MWVVTPPGGRDVPIDAVTGAVARSSSLAREPWEVPAGGWTVCGAKKAFRQEKTMRFILVFPAADLLVELPANIGGGRSLGPESDAVLATYRCSGMVNGRPSFISTQHAVFGRLRLFFLPIMGRWVLAAIREDGTGIETVVARSIPDDHSTWVSQWPWAVHRDGWERATAKTIGLSEGDASFTLDRRISVRLSSPDVTIHGASDPRLGGTFEACGMANDRVYYKRILEHSKHEHGGLMCIWFAEDRGQWVISPPERLGNSRLVIARISSRAWWPWEAHIGGTTSPVCLGSAPFSASPPWQGGVKLLGASCRRWEVANDSGGFTEDRGMSVKAMFEPRLRLTAGAEAVYPFLGAYEISGLLSSRPFYRQVPGSLPPAASLQAIVAEKVPPNFVLWYSEEHLRWVVSAEFRFMDHHSAEARVDDSTWVPSDTTAVWEVPDSVGGFASDPFLSAVVIPNGEPSILPEVQEAPPVSRLSSSRSSAVFGLNRSFTDVPSSVGGSRGETPLSRTFSLAPDSTFDF